jgi:secreted trypsin-like serine protease
LVGARRKTAVALACALMGLSGLAAVATPANAARGGGPKAGKAIVGGKAANFAEWPFAAAILFDGHVGCGGSVLAPTKVLTAAHCAFGVNVARLSVVTGRPNLTDPSVGQVSAVSSAAVHPDYAGTGQHDLAVLTLATPTTATPVTPASASDNGALKPGKRVRVAGYGSQKPAGGNLSPVLKETKLKVYKARVCIFVFGPDLFVPKTMFCANGTKLIGKKSKKQHTSACRGDSGGPLIASTPAGVRQVGVVSFGPRKCGRIFPAVYARVASGADFIAAAMAAP